MIQPDIPENEALRLDSLKEYSILDTLPEKEYDEITLLASMICGTPISLISLIDQNRQWFKSHHGTHTTQTSRDVAFCAHAINEPNKILVVEDSREDERFHNNPLVIEDPKIVFYAGIPLVNPNGYALGTLCVVDNQPRHLNEQQLNALQALSNQLMKLFELRKNTIALQSSVFELEAKNSALKEYAQVAAHDIRSPLSNMVMFSEVLETGFQEQLGEKGLHYAKVISSSAKRLIGLTEGILRYSKDTNLLNENKQFIELYPTLNEIVSLLKPDYEVNFLIEVAKDCKIYTNKIAIERILINLINNSLKYNDKTIPQVRIIVKELTSEICFNVCDNGSGIKLEDQQRIFRLFETASIEDRYGEKGFGIGLATVKSLVEGLKGKIKVKSELEKGTCFSFRIPK